MSARARTLVGIGLRAPHVDALLASLPPLGCVEVHSENHFADGGASLAWLDEVRQHYPVSLHGVGLALGSAAGLDADHLARLARLVARINPVRVSDHACFGRVARQAPLPPVHASDLLPLAFTPVSLDILATHVQQVQDHLRRPLLIENLTAYVHHAHDTLTETEFLTALCRRTGCRLLLDLNNLLVNGLNKVRRPPHGPHLTQAAALQQASALALDAVWSLPADIVGQLHLAGFRWPQQADALVIDDHSQRMSPTGWALYRQALAHLGPVPTVIEWDTDLPGLAVLLDEARLAEEALRETCEGLDTGMHDDDWG